MLTNLIMTIQQNALNQRNLIAANNNLGTQQLQNLGANQLDGTISELSTNIKKCQSQANMISNMVEDHENYKPTAAAKKESKADRITSFMNDSLSNLSDGESEHSRTSFTRKLN